MNSENFFSESTNISTLFQLIGLALIAAGSLVVVGADFIASVLKAFEDIPALSSVVSGLAWALIGLGIFLVVMGVLGGCGACCSIKVFLIGVSIGKHFRYLHMFCFFVGFFFVVCFVILGGGYVLFCF